jgi:hypothetical protein
MSTILKALRRLEEQKSGAERRPLRDEVVVTPSRAKRRTGVGGAFSGASGLAVVGAALVALFDRVPTEARRAAGDVAAPPEPAAPIAIAEERATEVFVSDPALDPRDLEGLVVPVPGSEPDFEIVKPVSSKPRQLIPTMQVDARPIEEPRVPAAGSTRPSPVPRVVEPEYEYYEEEIAPTPVVRSSPVYVDRTQWHPRPERRVAWVEIEGTSALREVHEGDRVGPYVVRVIEPAAVLFSEGSTQLRREIGR